MDPLHGRLRPILVSVVALVLSAGAALAGGNGPSPNADFGLETAEEASGQTVPARPSDEGDVVEPEAEDEPEDEDEDELGVEVEVLEEHPDNHGALVSAAAHADVPEGFANRGEFVSCVARMNRGHDAEPEADFDVTTLTPEDCEDVATDAETEVGPASGPGRSGTAKERVAAMKAARIRSHPNR